MVEESKKLEGFHNGFLPMAADVDADFIRYRTLEEVPVCVVNGDKKPQDWFTPEADLQRVWFYPPSEATLRKHAEKFRELSDEARDDPLLVDHYKPGEIEKRKAREAAELQSGKRKKPTDLALLRNARSDPDVVRLQAGNNGYRFVKKNVFGQPEPVTYELCRGPHEVGPPRWAIEPGFTRPSILAPLPDPNAGIPFYAYKSGEHKVFDKEKCQANAATFFAPVEALRDKATILSIIAVGGLQSPDYCVGDSLWISSSENGVYRLDEVIGPRILASGLPQAQNIVAHMQAAQVGTRINMERKDKMEENQVRAMSHSKYAIIGATVVNVLALLYISGKIKLSRILKKIRNISAEAKSGALGEPRHWRGMNDDLKKMAEIMGAPEINSVRTIGPNGSGKSARWEALAVCIQYGHFPDGTPIPAHLKGKTVYELVPKSHIMGESDSSFIGSAERFIRRVAKAVSKRGDILHVDEAHTLHHLASTGATADSGGAEEGLKPMMARKGKKGKKARLGFSSTEEEYDKSLANNKALHGRTIPVYVSEPTPEETLDIMRHKKDLYQQDAKRPINDSALQAAVELTKSDTDTHYPRKAEKLLGLAYQKAGPKEEITAEHVETAARDLVEKAVQKAADDAIAARNEAELDLEPAERARILQESIEKVVRAWVEGFEGELDETRQTKLERLTDIVARSWAKAVKEAPMIRSVHKPSADPFEASYGVPESFTEQTLQNCADKEGIRVRSEAADVSRRGRRGGLPPPPPPPRRGGAGGAPPGFGVSRGASPAAGAPEAGEASRPVEETTPEGGEVNRTRLVEEKAPRARGVFEHVGGVAPLFGLFAGAATLRHNSLISENQEGLFNAIVLGIFAYGSPVALIGSAGGAQLGHGLGTSLAQETGLQSLLPDWLPADKIVGIGGGFAGFALNEKFNQRFARYRNLSEAGRLGMQHTGRVVMTRIGAAGEVVEERLVQGARSVAQTARQAAAAGVNMARQAVPVIRQTVQQVRSVAANAAPGTLVIAPAAAALKSGAATGAAAVVATVGAGTTLLAGGILAAGAGTAYLIYRDGTGERLADTLHDTRLGHWLAHKLYGIGTR